MSEELRKHLSNMLVDAHHAFDLIPLKTHRRERQKINSIMSIIESIGKALTLDVGKEVDAIIVAEIEEQFEEIRKEERQIVGCDLFGLRHAVASVKYNCNECLAMVECATRSGIVRSYNVEKDTRPSVPSCPKCGQPLGNVEGAWICFTPYWNCGIMSEDR